MIVEFVVIFLLFFSTLCQAIQPREGERERERVRNLYMIRGGHIRLKGQFFDQSRIAITHL
jgi:hypothetical protein